MDRCSHFFFLKEAFFFYDGFVFTHPKSPAYLDSSRELVDGHESL